VSEYIINMGLIGMLCGLVFALPLVLINAEENHHPPRKTIWHLVLGFAGVTLAVIFFPLFIVAGVLYLVIAFTKNDWTWYER
jgi:ABC-type uncharacterized transport system permease subunit